MDSKTTKTEKYQKAKQILLVILFVAVMFCLFFGEELDRHLTLQREEQKVTSLFLNEEYAEAVEYGNQDLRQYRFDDKHRKIWYAACMADAYETGNYAKAYKHLETITEDFKYTSCGRKYDEKIKEWTERLTEDKTEIMQTLYDDGLVLAKQNDILNAYEKFKQMYAIDRSFTRKYKDAYDLYAYCAGYKFYQDGNLLLAEDYLCNGVKSIDESIKIDDPVIHQQCRTLQYKVLAAWREESDYGKTQETVPKNNYTHSGRHNSADDELPAQDYYDAEDFYDDYYDDFYDFEDAEDYWYEHNGY